MATEDAWEIDIETLTVNDVITLEDAGRGGIDSFRQARDILGRLVVNRTPEQIGELTLSELKEHLDRLGEIIQELSIPKKNDTP